MAKGKRSTRTSIDDDDKPCYAKGFNTLRITPVKFKTPRQQKLSEAIQSNDITFAIGSAGTGKSFIPVYEAVQALKDGDIDGIILSRPTVEAGGTMGFLPGNTDEKLGPYMAPLLDCFEDLIGIDSMQELIAAKIIQFIPIQFMRGRTFKKKFILVDEAQNATKEQLKLCLTRIGEDSIMVVTADDKQIDINNGDSCIHDLPRFDNVEGIGFVRFSDREVIRSKAVKLVLSCYQGKPIAPMKDLNA